MSHDEFLQLSPRAASKLLTVNTDYVSYNLSQDRRRVQPAPCPPGVIDALGGLRIIEAVRDLPYDVHVG